VLKKIITKMLILILLSVLVTFSSIVSAAITSAQSTPETYFDLDTEQLSYSHPKNIFIAASIGGSSVSYRYLRYESANILKVFG
jgi:hypothetical protein